jgi:hypothetical protein
MPNYEFTNQAGQVVEVYYPMSTVPSVGEVVQHPERGTLTRILSSAQLSPNFTTGTYPYVSHTLPRNMPGVRCDATGHPIISSRKHERNVASEHGYIRAED